MILHNTTFIVSPAISEEFIGWIKSAFIPAIAKAGYLHDPLLTRILPPEEEGSSDCESYALQFKAECHDDANRWIEDVAAGMLTAQQKRHGDKLLAFSTIMEII